MSKETKETTQLKQTFSKRLSKLRVSRGYNKSKDFADELGVKYQMYWNWENGIHLPETYQLINLSNALGVSVGYLLGCENEPVENAFDISNQIGLSTEVVSYLSKHKNNKAYIQLVNQILSNNAFMQALESISKAQVIHYRLKGKHAKTEGITLDQARNCIRADNLQNTSMMLADGEFVRDYHISHATKCMERLFELIVRGE